jgi:hypothetical protein
MNNLERFRAVCKWQSVDYVPIIGLPGASGVCFGGAWGQIYDQLIATGMPKHVKGWTFDNQWDFEAAKSWSKFWGTLTPLVFDFFPAEMPGEIKFNRKIDGQYEILEYETGAITRQLNDNDNIYSMPEFIKYHVRDGQSWQAYKKLISPLQKWSAEKIEQHCKKFDNRSYPLFMSLKSTWGFVRDIAGAENACTLLYDNPDLVGEIIDWQHKIRKEFLFPLVERLKPEIVQLSEDCCYNHGMLISPKHFERFCVPIYREISSLADSYGADMFAVDTDGKIDELVPMLDNCGANATYPVEAKSCNNLIDLRRKFPKFIFIGWLEKEVINQGNENLIEDEIDSKVLPMLKRGRYFPNIDHSIQPLCTFKNMCRFMNHLHKTLNNPEGEFYKYV